jgi:hypothetical protein
LRLNCEVLVVDFHWCSPCDVTGNAAVLRREFLRMRDAGARADNFSLCGRPSSASRRCDPS